MWRLVREAHIGPLGSMLGTHFNAVVTDDFQCIPHPSALNDRLPGVRER